MDNWQKYLIMQQINAALSTLFMFLKEKEWHKPLRAPILKIVRVAKELYPDAEEFRPAAQVDEQVTL